MKHKSTIQPGETLKWCSACQAEKPLDEFHKNKSRPDGLQNYCKLCGYAAYRKSYAKNRHKYDYSRHHKKKNLMTNYGLAIEEYDLMLLEQNNRCSICHEEMDKPHVDHCHMSGKVRSLLCGQCNQGLGQFKDNTELLLRAVSYLDSYNEKGRV